MKVTRILQFSTENGNGEYVVFTEDLKMDAEEKRRPQFQLDSDVTIDAEMPSGFPLDYLLNRD